MYKLKNSLILSTLPKKEVLGLMKYSSKTLKNLPYLCQLRSEHSLGERFKYARNEIVELEYFIKH